MKTIKPKEVATRLGIRPNQVSILAKDIENANLYRFLKTPLGSYIFLEKEIEILKEYNQTFYFFKKKKQALEMLSYKIESLVEEDKKPKWVKFLENAVYVK